MAFFKRGDGEDGDKSTTSRWGRGGGAGSKPGGADRFRRSEEKTPSAAERVAAKARARAERRRQQRESSESRPAPTNEGGARRDLLKTPGQGQAVSRGRAPLDGRPTPPPDRPPPKVVKLRKGQRERPRDQVDHPLLRELEEDLPGSPPQRGSISSELKALLTYQVAVADKIRQKLAPDVPLDRPLEATDERKKELRRLCKGYFHRAKPPGGADPRELLAAIEDEVFGFGPIQSLIDDAVISEVMVNGPYIVFIEVEGKLVESGYKFRDDAHVVRIIKRIVLPLGRQVSYHTPLIDARLPDGSRVNATIPPCAIDGPNITIRKFSKEKLKMEDLIEFGSLTPDMATFLEALVVARQNIIVSGGTGSGKTTLINCLSAYVPHDERVVTIEDAAELQMKQRNVVRLETKKPAPDSPTEVSIRNCVVNSLRMRPERIVVGECRAGEALDMLQAMNTGHDGSMTTVHANDPRACISRLETLCLMSGVDLPIMVVRRQIVTAIHVIVQAARLRDGSRKVTHITEVERMEGDVPITSNIFTYVESDDPETGELTGIHSPTGNRPNCEPLLRRAGYKFSAEFFQPVRR